MSNKIQKLKAQLSKISTHASSKGSKHLINPLFIEFIICHFGFLEPDWENTLV